MNQWIVISALTFVIVLIGVMLFSEDGTIITGFAEAVSNNTYIEGPECGEGTCVTFINALQFS